MPCPLDPELDAIVAAMRLKSAPSPFSGTPVQARARMHDAIMASRKEADLPAVGSAEDMIAQHRADKVPVRVYRPRNTVYPLPTIVFFHGGGFVLGSVELMDDIARKLCRDVNAVIVSIDYRLAPENPFPAAHDDALAGTLWALQNVASLGGDRSRFALAGESAGANLAASTAIVLRDRGIEITAQLLIVPGVNFARDTKSLAAKRNDYPMLSPADLDDIARLYMGVRRNEANSFPPSPLYASSHSHVAPALIVVAGHDPLYDEGIAYAECLRRAQVPVEILRFDDMFHPFFGFFTLSSAARRANDRTCARFKDWIEEHARA